MKESLRLRLDQLCDRHEELEALLADVEVISDNKRFRNLSREHNDLSEITDVWKKYKQAEEDIETAEVMLTDPDFKDMAIDEIKENKALIERLESELNILMIPKDPNDANSAYLEIRAGTGGDEAAIFSGDLFRMYSKYAETQNWRIEILSENEGEHGGYKEIICLVNGEGVYGRLKFESGAHRVQRVPATESQGRVHTSACTVAILPEVDVDTTVEINAADLRIDTYRASGAGGQHINKTDSAVRITHLPTGTVVECQDERSQHKNKAKAMALLASRLENAKRAAADAATSEMRRDLVGSGDRSERIRTYNYPQGRMTDHRINLTLYKLDAVMEGDLTELLDSLHREYQADQLAMLAQQNGWLMNIAQALALRGEAESYERQENAWLLEHILKIDAFDLSLKSTQELTAEQEQQYVEGLARIAAGEPLAYVTGSQPFWTLDLTVTKDTLVPRPDTEVLVETVLNLDLPEDTRMVDLGTGTGAIALSLASERPNWSIIATDIYEPTLEVALHNAEKHDLGQVKFFLGSWFKALNRQFFDVIVSNPPYIDADDEHMPHLASEPERALVAEQHGLADIEHIVQQGKKWLATQGWIVLEHGYDQAEAVQNIFKGAGFKQVRTVKDYGGNDRVTLGQWPN